MLNGAGQRLLKVPGGNERIVVTQRLWRLPPEAGQAGDAAAGGGDEEAAGGGGRASKKQRKGKKARARQDENADANDKGGAVAAGSGSETGPGIPAGSELLLVVENKTPNKETFQFARVADGLQQSGRYALEFVAAPVAPGQPPLRTVVKLHVAPGPPCSIGLSGEGKAVAALRELALGGFLAELPEYVHMCMEVVLCSPLQLLNHPFLATFLLPDRAQPAESVACPYGSVPLFPCLPCRRGATTPQSDVCRPLWQPGARGAHRHATQPDHCRSAAWARWRAAAV